MNIERLVLGFGRRILMRLAFRGVEIGIDKAVGGQKADQTPEDKARARAAKRTARQARQSAKLARRVMRMR